MLRKLRAVQDYEDHFEDERHVRTALAAYYGMVSFLDDNIGRVLQALEASGLAEDTLVVYTSDHGDNLGTRTFWGKSNMYEEAVGVPLILQGAGVPRGRRVRTPVSLVDGYPTILEAVGVPPGAAERGLPGASLLGLAQGDDPERTVFSEYHAFASITGIFMVRFGRWKYVHYEGYRPQLYDLEADPGETRDLAAPTRRRSPRAIAAFARSAIRPKSRRAPSPTRPAASPSSAAPRRSARWAATPTPPPRAKPPASRREAAPP